VASGCWALGDPSSSETGAFQEARLPLAGDWERGSAVAKAGSLQRHLPCRAGVPLSAFGYFPALVTTCSLKNETKEKGTKTGKKKRDRLENGCAASRERPAWNRRVDGVRDAWQEGRQWLPHLLLTYLPANQSSLQTSCSSSRAAVAQLLPHTGAGAWPRRARVVKDLMGRA